MKILHIDDRFTPQGGVGQYILELSALLADAGHESILVYRSDSGRHDLPLRSHLLREPVGVATVWLKDVIAHEKPDVALAHQVSTPQLLRHLRQVLPTVAYIHGFAMVCPGLAKLHRRSGFPCPQPFSWRCFFQNYLQRCSSARNPATMLRMMRDAAALQSAYQMVDRYLVASRYMRDLLIQNGFVDQRVHIVPPHFVTTADVGVYAPPDEAPTLLYAGRLEQEKGIPVLLNALRRLPESARLIVAGDGSRRTQYEALSASLGLEERVVFAGWQDSAQLAQLYRRCSVVVVPSTWPEPFGKVGVEAMAHGRPVVAFDVGGISQWLSDGLTGTLVPPGDVGALASAISSLLADPARRELMGRNGQTYVLETYGAQGHIEAMVSTLQAAIDGRASALGGTR